MAEDLTNKTFGQLRVVEKAPRDKQRKARWLCECSCGKRLVVSGCKLNSQKSCGCGRATGERSHNWSGHREITGRYWSSVRHGASKRGFAFDISLEYAWKVFVEQGGRCIFTGRLLSFGNNQTASLDRIDSSLGYVEGNIQWVDKELQFMKRARDDASFVSSCREVADYRSLTDTNKG